MKNTLFALTILSVFIFGSCSKSNDSTTPVATLPKTYTEDIRSSALNSLTTFNLTYDGNYRLVSMVGVPESIGKFVFQYPNSLTVTMDMYTGTQLSIHENFWLNTTNLFADSTLQYNDTQDTTTEKYFYSGDNLLLKANYYDYHTSGTTLTKTTSYTYDAFGNALTQTDNPGGTTTFTYYQTLSPFSIGNTFIPQSKNLIRSTSLDNGGTPIITMHYYSFDSSNRLIKDSITTSGVDVIVVKSYTY